MAQLDSPEAPPVRPLAPARKIIETWLLKSNREHLSRKLRMSLADSCNLRCFFCHNEGQGFGRVGVSRMSISDYREIVRSAVQAGVSEVKLTGGEPMLYRDGKHDIADLVAGLAELRKESHFGLSVITNGLLFPRYADRLKQAGLDRVTFSLHTLDQAMFRRLIQPTGRNSPDDVLKAIELAIAKEMTPVKVNTVLFGTEEDGNIGEIGAIVEACRKLGVAQLRFYTLLGHENFPDYQSWYRFWDQDLLAKLGSALYDSPEEREALVRDAAEFLDLATKVVYPKRTLVIGADGIEVAIEAMEAGRFELSEIPDEGPYALRLSASGELRGVLSTAAEAIDITAAMAGGDRGAALTEAFRRAQEHLLP